MKIIRIKKVNLPCLVNHNQSKASIRFVKRLYFTLLEMLVVLFIIGLIAGLTGVKIKEAYDEQLFATEVHQVASHLQMAQDMMLMMQNDVKMRFSLDPANQTITLTYHPTFEKQMPLIRAKMLKKPYTFKSIKSLEFDHQTLQSDCEIELTFFSGGMVMSKGRLILSPNDTTHASQSDRKQAYQIDLLGYPHFIESQKYQTFNKKEDPLLERTKGNLYPAKVLEEIYEKRNKNQ